MHEGMVNQFPSILPTDISLLSLERENVTAARSIYQEIFSYKEETHDGRRENILWAHYLRTFVDLDLHLFEQIIIVCRYMYDGFSVDNGK